MDPLQDVRAISALGQAYDVVAERIRMTNDLQQAFRISTELNDLLRELAEASADIRADLAGQLYYSTPMSYAALGDMLGISKARAAQLVARCRKSAFRTVRRESSAH